MKFWTIQKREIIECIKTNGCFQPDFTKSDYLQKLPELKDLYYIVLEAFNQLNGVNLPGLIFSFLKSEGKMIYQIENYEEFCDFIKSKKAVINSLWEQLKKNDVIVVELEYSEAFNPIFIDINDFQFLMPPIMIIEPYTEQDVERLCVNICKGQITQSVFPSDVIQAHLPYIKAENITNIYPMFDLD